MKVSDIELVEPVAKVATVKLVPVPFNRVREQWCWVRHGIECSVTKARTREMAEDIFCDMRDGKSYLYEINDGTPRGFMILQQRRDYDGLVLHVQVLWCPLGAPLTADILREMDKLAKACGCKRLTGGGRRGWEAFGFRAISVNFERELED